MTNTIISIADLETYIQQQLVEAGASRYMAEKTAYFLSRAEAQGLSSHGLSRLSQYRTHLKNGRAIGSAEPAIIKDNGACALVDAQMGLAYAACDVAVKLLEDKAKEFGISLVGVTNSHHFGVASLHLEQLAENGLIGLAFSNSPSAMTAWGGKRALFGTNPIAVAFPRIGHAPLIIDLSLSEVARGKLMVAANKGEKIPFGWALDSDGNSTDDPEAGLAGTMCPIGGVKGAMLALIVELLCVGLTNAAFAFEADSFFVDEGNQPRLGQCFIAINPGTMAGTDVFNERIETLIALMLQEDGVRLPGAKRQTKQAQSERDGVAVNL